MKLSVEHIAIPAADPVALKNWYERVLGAQPVWDNGQNPPTCLISLGNVWFEIYAADTSLEATRNNKLAGFRHLALGVDSLDAAKAELEKRGVKFTEEARPAAGGSSWWMSRAIDSPSRQSAEPLILSTPRLGMPWRRFST